MPKPRGRPPRDCKTVLVDEKIARAVDRLIMWGYTERQVMRPVALAAKRVLGRTNSHGTPLSPHSIEAIWKKHRPRGWEKYWPPDMLAKLGRPKWRRMWTTAKLRATRPAGYSVQMLAEEWMQGPPTERVWSPVDHEWHDYPVLAGIWGLSASVQFGAEETGVEK